MLFRKRLLYAGARLRSLVLRGAEGEKAEQRDRGGEDRQLSLHLALCLQTVGEEPPPEAKGGVDYKRMKDWLVMLTGRQRHIMYRRMGCRLDVVNSNGVWRLVT